MSAKRPANPCSWSNRCRTRPAVVVSEDERYCKTHAKKVADRYVGLFVKRRDRWTCQRCTRRAPNVEIQYAHVISRGARYIQYDPENAMALCEPCHRYFTVRPSAWSVFLATTRPGLHDRLGLLEAECEARGGGVDLAEIIREYRDRVLADGQPLGPCDGCGEELYDGDEHECPVLGTTVTATIIGRKA